MAPGHAKKYYLKRGAGIRDIGKLHYQPLYYQRGAGIGGFFSKLYSYLTPLASSGLSVLKEQAIRSGKEILNDLGTQPIQTILKNRGRQAVSDLTIKGLEKLKKEVNKQRGSGYIKRSAFMNPAILDKAINTRRRRRRKRRSTIQRKKRVKKVKQIGGRRRRRRNTRPKVKKRTLDIFN